MVPIKIAPYEGTTDEKRFLQHWGYLGLNDVLGVIAKWIDKIFLLYLLTSTDFAIFFNGSFEIPLFGLLISVIGSFLLIEISGNYQSSNKIIKLFNESFNMLSTIVFPLFFFLFFFGEELFSLVFKDKYNASLPIFLIGIFILPLRINSYTVILQCFSQGKKVLLGAILDLSIAIILMLILYPLMGMRGIALSIVLSTYCQVFYYLWHSAKILKTSIIHLIPFQKLITRLFVLLILFLILSFILSGVEFKLKLIIGLIFTTVLVLAGLTKYYKIFYKKEYGLKT